MTDLRLPEVARVRVRDLRPWSDNPRAHDAEQIRLLQKSMEAFGLLALPVAQRGTLRLLAGHGRVQAMLQAGYGESVIPVVLADLSEDEATAYTVADNRLSDLSEWNLPALRDALGELDNGAFDVELTGYTEEALGKLFGPLVEPDVILDDAEPEEEPEPELYELALYPDGTARVVGPRAQGVKEVLRAVCQGLTLKEREA